MAAVPEDVARLGPLVYSLCQQRKLPILVTDHLARYLDEQDLLTISVLSRTLNEQAKAIAYKHVVLDLGKERGRRRAALFLRTLLTTPTAISNVQSLYLIGEPLYQWRDHIARRHEGTERPLRGRHPPEILLDLTMFAPDELELYRNISSLQMTIRDSDWMITLPKLCLDIILLTNHHLEGLQISSDCFRYPEFRAGLKSMFVSGRFPNLQSSGLCIDVISGRRWRHITAVQDWDDTLLAPFSAPSIDSIISVMTLKPEAVSQMHANSITRLVLHHCQLEEFDLNGLLAATPRLHYLEYHAHVDYSLYTSHWTLSGMSRCLGLDPLFSALHHVCGTLTELVTSQKFEEDSKHFQWGCVAGRDPPFRQCYELSKLKCLRSLVTPFASLLGWSAKDRLVFDWHNILPASLQHVTFTDDLSENFTYGGWEEQDLMPVFADLGSFLGMYKRDDHHPRFTLRLQQMDTEFNEPVRQALSRSYEECGVLFSVDKRHRDRIYNRPRMSLGSKMRLFADRGRGRGRGRGSR
jgi:hypothetical protein